MRLAKRLLAFCMALIMVFTMLPPMAFASVEEYISDVKVSASAGTVTVEATTAAGHYGDVYCIIYNAHEWTGFENPATLNATDLYIGWAFYRAEAYKAETAPSSTVTLVPQNYSGQILYGDELRTWFIEQIVGGSVDDYVGATDDELGEAAESIDGKGPSSTWIAAVWSEQGGSEKDLQGNPNVHYTEFTLDDNGNLLAEQCEITWNLNYDGAPAAQTTSVNQGGVITAGDMPTDPERAGYKFLGWFDAEAGGTKIVAGTSNAPSADTVEYYAQWADIYDLSFDANGGTGDVPETKEYSEGEEIELPAKPDNLVKAGYTFLGWSANANPGAGDVISGKYTMPAADTTLYAVWGEKAEITAPDCSIVDVTYNGTEQTPAITVVGGGAVTITSIDVKDSGTVSGNKTAKNAQTYTVTFNVAESDTHKAATGLELDWNIHKATQVLALSADGLAGAAMELYTGRGAEVTVDSNADDIDWTAVTVASGAANATVSPDTLTDDKKFTISAVTASDSAVTITVTSPETGNYTAATQTISLTIKAAGDPNVNFAIETKTVEYGENYTETATAAPDIMATTGAIKYSSSETDIATVDSVTGAVTIHKIGTTVITAKVEAGDYNGHPYSAGLDIYTLTVEPRKLTIGAGDFDITKVYDGGVSTVAAMKSGDLALVNIYNNEDVTIDILDASYGDYNDKNVGNDKTVTISGIKLSGTDSSNYTLESNGSFTLTTAKITPAEVTVESMTLEKVYDATDALEAGDVAAAVLGGVVSGEYVVLAADGAEYASSDKGNDIAVTGAFKLSGADSGNYTLKQPTDVKGNITALTLNVEGTKLTKEYDKSAALIEANKTSATAIILAGILTADKGSVDVDYTGVEYNSKDVEGEKALTKQPALSGTKAGNYTLNYTTNFTGEITPKTVTATATPSAIATQIGIGANLGDAIITVTDGNDPLADTDYTLSYEVTDAGTTGIEVGVLTGAVTSAPSATGIGNDAAKATVTITLTGDAANNYVFASGANVLELTINVADGIFTVKFDANEGSGTMADMPNQAVGTNVTLPKNTFDREGYVFKGWAYTNDAQTALFEDEASVALTNNDGTPLQGGDTVILYAVWAQAYDLTVNAGDGGDTATGTGRYEAGTTVAINATAKPGFNFKEWKVTSGELTLNDATVASQNITMPDGPVTLTATYTANLTITGNSSITKTGYELANLKVGDFVATATPTFTGDTIANLFTASLTGTAGVFTGNGVTITFYTDTNYNTVYTAMSQPPNLVGIYYYTVEVTQAAVDTPKANYILQPLEATRGVLTVLRTGGGSGGPGGGGGGGGGVVAPSTFTVTYAPGQNGGFDVGASTTEVVSRGAAPSKAPAVNADSGYKFLGWSKDGQNVVDLSKESIIQNSTYTALYAPYNFADENNHQHYMIGRAEETFAPMGNLTRAEAATMLARLTPGFAEDGTYGPTDFNDVSSNHWAYKYICFSQSVAMIKGYENDDGSYSFRPDDPVTRGEFTTMIVRFKNIMPLEQRTNFGDSVGHWAEGYIVALVNVGIIDGYEDGTFRPDQTITRAEAAKIVNGAIGRAPNESADLEAAGYHNKFADVSESEWYFRNVMEATLDHATVDFH